MCSKSASSISISPSIGGTIASGLIPAPCRRNSRGSGRRSFIPLNRETKTAEVAKGVVVPIDRPFFGTMGLAPDPAMGRISSGPPGVHTGNLDNKDLVAGTTLFMPVHAPGALFSAGDAHAAQGHGEVDLTAIETGLRGKFQFILRKD